MGVFGGDSKEQAMKRLFAELNRLCDEAEADFMDDPYDGIVAGRRTLANEIRRVMRSIQIETTVAEIEVVRMADPEAKQKERQS